MSDGGDYTGAERRTNPPADDVLVNILSELEALRQSIQVQNGRVKKMEDWRDRHQKWSEDGRLLIEDQRKATEAVQERLTQMMLAIETSPANLEHAVARVLDKRQTTEDAAKYRALTRRFGSDPEESLNRWAGFKMGAQAVGWRIAGVVITVLVTGLMMWFAALWVVSGQAAP